MERLNIPMGRQIRTTRQSRWVVWLIILLVLFAIFFTWGISMLVLTRNTTTSFAPTNVEIIIKLNPNRNTWEKIEKYLSGIPLITNRSLTVSDIKPFTYGEFSILIEKNGQSSVVIRTKKDQIPHEILDAEGIVVQKLKRNIYLLSNKLLPVNEIHDLPKIRRFFSFFDIGKTFLGNVIFLGEEPEAGRIMAVKNGLDVYLPKKEISELPWKSFPKNIIGAASLPILPNVDFSALIMAADVITEALDSPSVGEIIQLFQNHGGVVLLSSDDQGLGFVLAGENFEFAPENQLKLLKLSAALTTPKIVEMKLPDNSIADELIIDPAEQTIEQKTVFGTPVSRVKTGFGPYFYTIEAENMLVFSNREDLLLFWLNGEAGEDPHNGCNASNSFININALTNIKSSEVQARDSSSIQAFSTNISRIGIENRRFSTVIHFCE